MGLWARGALNLVRQAGSGLNSLPGIALNCRLTGSSQKISRKGAIMSDEVVRGGRDTDDSESVQSRSSNEEALEYLFREALSIFNQSNYARSMGVYLPFDRGIMLMNSYTLSLRGAEEISSPLDFFEGRQVTNRTARLFADRYIHSQMALYPDQLEESTRSSLLGSLFGSARDALTGSGGSKTPRPAPLNGRENMPAVRKPS